MERNSFTWTERLTRINTLFSLGGYIYAGVMTAIAVISGFLTWLSSANEVVAGYGRAGYVAVFVLICVLVALTFFLVAFGLYGFSKWRNKVAQTGTSKIPPVSDESIGSFGRIKITPAYLDPGENFGGKQEFQRVEISFVFAHTVSRCTIGISSVFARYVGDTYHERKRYSWRYCEDKRFLPNEEIAIPLFFLASNFQHHGYYGDFAVGEMHLTSSTDHVVVIRIDAGDCVQTKRLFLHLPDPRHHGGRFFLVQKEGQKIFDAVAVESASDKPRAPAVWGP